MKYLLPAVALLPTVAYGADKQPSTPKKMNVIVVMADQFRGEAFGFMGKEATKTPNFDKFAQRSVVLNQAVSCYPVSSPARGMLMSGAYPHNNNVLTNCQSHSAPQNVELRDDLVCWSDILASQGYATSYFGKWHLDKPYTPYIDCSNNRGDYKWNEWCPPERRHGFAEWVAYGTYDNHLRPLYWNTDSKREEFYYVDQWGPEYETDLAIKAIERSADGDQPFAIMVSMNPPHTGYDLVPQRYKDLYADLNVDSIAMSIDHLQSSTPANIQMFRNSVADYYACISGVDDQFGRIISALEAQGLMDNTIVIFTSDHGDSMGMHDNIGKNVIFEEAMRIPFFIYSKELEPRFDNQLLFSLEDFYPTLMHLMGFEDQIPSTVQSRDLSAQILGSTKQMPQSQLYMLYSKVNKDGKNLDCGSRGVRNLRYSYVVKFDGGVVTSEELYDRQSDPSQLVNVAQSQVKITKGLRRELYKRLNEIGDPTAPIIKNLL